MREHGLAAAGWVFEFNAAKRAAGYCKYPGRGRPGRVQLSRHYAEHNARADVTDTILHEIAHALAGPAAGHGPVWVAVCRVVGARPDRLYDAARVVMPKGQWRATCRRCQKEFHRHRRPRANVRHYCTKCGPVLGRLGWSVPQLTPTGG